MKRMMIMIAAVMAMCLSANVFAQDQQRQNRRPEGSQMQNREERGAGWMEKMKAARVAFLTTELDLSAKEAEAFWPIYNQAQEEKDAAFKNTRTAYREMMAAIKDGKSDKEVAVLLDKYLKAAKVPAELDAEYAPEYLKVLPATKVAKLYASEEKFRKMQFQNMQGHGRNPGGPRDGEVQGQRPSRDGQFQRGQRGQRNGSQPEENAGTQM
jgi:hypothetical protein